VEVAAEILLELVAELEERAEIQQLEAQVEIRQPEELKVLDVLRLSVEVLAEVLLEVLADIAVEVLAEILAAEVLVKLAGGMELV
jgi:hypothetical protein